ncbi:MAG: glycerophosphodiester phosphodiesterase family protein, partial [Solirubrobacteraceae bacterium]
MSDPAPMGPLVVAHRGAWGEFPQNSLPALAAAIETGCEMAELDVRRTRDGRLVAMHDARVRGTQVGALDHAELTARLQPGQAPLLEEMIELAANRIALD